MQGDVANVREGCSFRMSCESLTVRPGMLLVGQEGTCGAKGDFGNGSGDTFTPQRWMLPPTALSCDEIRDRL
jgi:hypothetical protein